MPEDSGAAVEVLSASRDQGVTLAREVDLLRAEVAELALKVERLQEEH